MSGSEEYNDAAPDSPLVSVLVPVRNSAPLLPEALFSIYYQTYPNLEIIIVDDCSSDPSAQIAEVFAKTGSNVYVSRNPEPMGFVETARRCYLQAKGEYIKFLLPQDRLRINAIDKLVSAMSEDESVVLASCGQTGIGIDGSAQDMPLDADWFDKKEGVVIGRVVGNEMLSAATNIIGELSALMFEKSRVPIEKLFGLGKVERFNYLGDFALILRLLATGNLYYVDDTLAEIRVQENHIVSRPTGFYNSLTEWPSLLTEAKRVAYLDLPSDEVKAMSRTFYWISELFRADPNQIFISRIPDVVDQLFSHIDLLYERTMGTRYSMIIGPDDEISGKWIMELSTLLSTQIELILLERPGEMPTFSIADTMLPIKTMEMPLVLPRFATWQIAVSGVSGHFLFFMNQANSIAPEVYVAGVKEMRRNPKCGLVRIIDLKSELSGIVMRKDVFSNIYGIPEVQDGQLSKYSFEQLAQWLSNRVLSIGLESNSILQTSETIPDSFCKVERS